MSYQATGWVLEFSESQLGARLVLHSIAYHLNKDADWCFPSLDTIAKECRMTKSGVIQAMERLEQSGELTVERTERPGSGSVNRYSMPLFLAWWEEAKKIGEKGKKGQPYCEKGIADSGERVNGIEKRVNAIRKKGVRDIPEPEVEPEVEPERKNQMNQVLSLPFKKDSQEEKASPNYGLFRTRFRSLTGILANTYKDNQAKYEELCRNFGEDAVLEALAEWVKSEGKDEIKKHGKWAAKHFFEEAEILITTSAPEEDDEEDPEASFPHMEGDVDAKEEYYRRFPRYAPLSWRIKHGMEPQREEIFEDAGTTPEAKPAKA